MPKTQTRQCFKIVFPVTAPSKFKVTRNTGNSNAKPKKEYTPIKSYKPSGNLIYDDDLLNKIEDRFH